METGQNKIILLMNLTLVVLTGLVLKCGTSHGPLSCVGILWFWQSFYKTQRVEDILHLL